MFILEAFQFIENVVDYAFTYYFVHIYNNNITLYES